MAGEWLETTIGELIGEQGGSIKTGPFGTTLKASEYSVEGVPLISVREVGYGTLRVDESTPRVPPVVTERLPEYLLRTGDIVFGRKGAVDRSAHINVEHNGWFLGSDGIRLRLPETCDSRFMAYQIQSPSTRAWLIQHATGTTMASLNQGVIERLPIVAPPFPIQRAIAHILGSLDDKIELNRRMNETLEEMARALFKSWFVNFDPVRAKMEGRQAYGMDDDTAALFPDSFEDSPLGEIPKGWSVGSLGDIADNIRRSVDPAEVAPSMPYIGLDHMPRKRIALSEWGEAEQVASGKFEFHWGEVLFGKLRPYFHKVGVAPMDGVCSTDILVVAPRLSLWYGLTLCHLSSVELVNHADATSTGTKMPRAKWSDLALFPITIPSEEVAEEFTESVRPLIDRIQVNIHQSHTLAAIRDALLPKLLSGEVRVAEAAEIVEEVY